MCISTEDCHFAIKRKEALPFAVPRTDLESVTLSEVGRRERQILWGLSCMWNLKKKSHSRKQ